ncbi:MAG: FHA domain-containing protein [Desulfobacteraceae bacterium]|nr:MAG: FHA domain-containing protein [Desulfobacteraceae bacterium]
MDTIEINRGAFGQRDHVIQSYNTNLVLSDRAFPYKEKTSDDQPKKVVSSLEEEQIRCAKLCVIEGPIKGKEFDLTVNTAFVGRSSRNDIQIKDIMVSRKHLKISRTGETFSVEDLRSTNGTLLNGKTIEPGECIEMGNKDTISIGDTVFRFGEISGNAPPDVDDLGGSYAEHNKNGKPNAINERRSPSKKELELDKILGMFEKTLNINGMIEKLLELLLDTLPRIDRAAILVFNNQKGKIKEVMSRSRKEQQNEAVRYNRGLLGRIAKTGKVVKVSDTTYEAKTDRSENMDTTQTSSTLCVPIIVKSRIRGAIYLSSLRGPYDGFRKEDLLLLNTLSSFVAVAIENSTLLTE